MWKIMAVTQFFEIVKETLVLNYSEQDLTFN